jgi:hypothetical protein
MRRDMINRKILTTVTGEQSDNFFRGETSI